LSRRGALAAYRGYRLQALYALKRILAPTIDPGFLFHLEGREDLDVRDMDDRLAEAIQVKSYENLVLSDLEPAKPGSFFHRAAELLRTSDIPHIKLVNFGAIGPEMGQAWAGDEPHRSRVAQKFKECGFQDADIEAIFDHVELVELDESQERHAVYSYLQDALTGVDPDSAFDLLNAWLYNAAEHKERVTRFDVVERVNNIGRFLAERYAYHGEWFTSIMPLTDRDILSEQRAELKDEFYAGVAARYEHILAGLDFRRGNKLAEVAAKFENSRVVIVHGASGQGKTSLAYRYLHDAYPEAWRFAIEVIEGRQHALEIARALAGHANAIGVPMAIYIDVSPRDTAWPELVKPLARHPGFHILVTIREEDFRRTSMPGAELKYETVELTFDEAEARQIYERAVASGQASEFLDFDEAWDRFGGKGPLMEFVYLLTQTTTLRTRLQGQVHRIRDEVRKTKAHPDELVLLRLVSIASAHEARLHTTHLLGQLDLPDPDHTLKLFEKEYLIRLSSDRHYIEGLHPIRSQILTDLLVSPDVDPWIESATQVLSLMVEEDIESFALHALVDRPLDSARLLEALKKLGPTTWAGLAGVLRFLLWSCAREYVERNLAVIDRAHKEFGQSWLFIIDFDLTGVTTPETADSWARLSDLFPEEHWAAMEKIRASQTPKVDALQTARAWLAQRSTEPVPPSLTTDWDGAAEVCFWSGWWEVAPHIEEWLSDDDLDRVVKDLDLSRLADLSLALYQCNQERHTEWIQKQSSTLQARLAQEYNILALEGQEDVLKLHYWPLRYDQDEQEAGEGKQISMDAYHEQAMDRIRLARRLFPGHRAYGTQGYGYRIGHLPLPVDDSSVNKKGVPASMLPPAWPVRVNAAANGLARNRFRPDMWAEYVDLVLETRRLVVTCLDQLHRGLLKYLQRTKGLNLFEEYIDTTLWDRCSALLGDRPLLPQSAVDPWGFAHEFLSSEFVQHPRQQAELPKAIALQKYKPYLDAAREYSSSLFNFLQQSPNVMLTNFWVGKLPTYSTQRDKLLEALQGQGVKTDLAFLSTYNLATAKKQLATYQARFRLLFGHMVDDELSALEARERDLLWGVWPLWYVFAYNPDQAWASPATQVPSRVNLVKHGIMRRVQQTLDGISEEGCHVSILSIKEDWDGAPTLWLQLDLQDPTKLYTKFEELVIALRDSIGPIEFGNLDHYVIEDNWECIAVVPVIRGRMLNRSAWRLLTFGAVLGDKDPEENPWLYVPLPIPSGAWEALGIDLWNLEDIRLADRFSESVGGLYLRVSQLGEFRGMPELPDPAYPFAQSYIERQGQEINRDLQIVFDTAAEMSDKFDKLSKPEQDERKNLLEAMASLVEVHRLVKPSDEFNGSQALGIGELADYAQRLELAQQLTERIRLFWIVDVLDHLS
jgi:hypothetical protein